MYEEYWGFKEKPFQNTPDPQFFYKSSEHEEALMKDKTDMSQNVALQPEDVVYVPKKFIANVNYAITQILGPISQGAYTAKTFSDW